MKIRKLGKCREKVNAIFFGSDSIIVGKYFLIVFFKISEDLATIIEAILTSFLALQNITIDYLYVCTRLLSEGKALI